jgi:hypothetical protein
MTVTPREKMSCSMRLVRSIALCAAIVGASACSGGGDTAAPGDTTSGTTSDASPRAAPHTPASNLETTPLSAADYALYESMMSGASAMLMNLDATDRQALELSHEVDAGKRKATSADEALLARAVALTHKDEGLAELQGVALRYRQVKEKVNAVVGRNAEPPEKDDAVARENRRFLAVHRANIERLQAVLRDPLSRRPAAQ